MEEEEDEGGLQVEAAVQELLVSMDGCRAVQCIGIKSVTIQGSAECSAECNAEQ
jgi:hypothetical protein